MTNVLTTTTAQRPAAAPLFVTVLAGLGLAWNVFGLVRFVQSVTASPQDMQAAGMTAEQVAVYANLPVWMNVAFAIGVLGGVAGCLLLLARRRAAAPVLATSLVGYVVLYVGDIVHGVFAAFGASQVAVLTVVVAIAAGLWALTRFADRRGILR